jgi:hypothetical protein
MSLAASATPSTAAACDVLFETIAAANAPAARMYSTLTAVPQGVASALVFMPL